ncbi:MAG: alpha/beta hydrolase [Oscillospiraceae bacterium]
MMQIIWIILGILVLVILLVGLGGALFFFDYAVRRKPAKPDRPVDKKSPWAYLRPLMDQGKKWIGEQKPERVEIQSFDGLTLTGFLLEQKKEPESHRVMVMMHGFRSHDFNDFALSVRYFYDAGYHVLLCDQRAHGGSQGKYLTFGVKERYDCRDWAKFGAERWGENTRVFLMGVSMGAATVLMSLGLDLPKAVKGVVADCGYTSPKAIFAHVLKHSYHLPCFPILNVANMLCKWRAGFGLSEYSTLDALEKNKIPVFFLHGGKDDFVPKTMTEQNYEKCTARKELLIIDEAAHAMSFLCKPEKCFREINRFLDGCE